MINRIHFTTFGGGLYPGGGRGYNRMCFLFIRERACNWATSFPARFSPGKTALGTRLPIDGPITGQPRSQGPLLPVPVEQKGRRFPGAPNDCFLWNISSEKQKLPRIFYSLRKAKNLLMTVPFMYNFGSLINKFLTIFWSLIFPISLPMLAHFS